ncbi:MAG: hypothetical protein MJY86_04815 [Bacteroidales bacterium]|nr:hypothetical protein [Candidatus Cryptobacteroides faecihippi]MCQ2162581.1 hypothetical protein [Bacteroidales bacterium]
MALSWKKAAIIGLGLASSMLPISCGGNSDINDGPDKPGSGESDKPAAETGYGTPTATTGWVIYTAGYYHYGPSYICNEDGSIDGWFSAHGTYFDYDKILLTSEEPHTTAYHVSDGDAAQYFNCPVPFYSVQICCPTWNSTEEAVTLKLFKWKNDYETTIAGEPVYQTRKTNMEDNGWICLYASEEAKNDKKTQLPAGEYLWLATEGTEKAGIWTIDKTSASSGGLAPKSYKNGVRQDKLQFECRVLTEYSECKTFWDMVTYQHSTDGGKTWSKIENTLIPTEFSLDALSCCDPGVAKWGGWYYLAYTSTEDTRGTDNNVFVARSKNPNGPWEKWNGNGWGGNPKPVIQYHGVGNKDCYGAGEPCFVVVDGTVYFYYTWSEPKATTRVSLAKADDENWPAHLEHKGTAIDKTNAAYQQTDHSDVKYRPDLKKFYAINTAKRMTADSYIQVWVSNDGLKFTLEGKMKGSMKPGLHNCGWSGDEMGIQDPAKPQYVSYAYGIDTWARWNTWFSPLTFPKK